MGINFLAGKFVKSRRFNVIAIFIVLLLVLGGVLALSGGGKSKQAQNTNRFQQAQSAVNTLYMDIKQRAKPSYAKRNDSCTTFYKGLPGYGDLTCSTAALLVYTAGDKGTLKKIYSSAQAAISAHKDLFQPTETAASSTSDPFARFSVTSTEIDYYESFGLKCIVNYLFKQPAEFDITIGCSGAAPQAYFPLDNKHR